MHSMQGMQYWMADPKLVITHYSMTIKLLNKFNILLVTPNAVYFGEFLTANVFSISA